MTDLTLFDWIPQDETPQMTELREAFETFHRDNPHVYALFDKFTRQAIKAGHEHFSADAIVHRIRWSTSVETKGDEFKLNNNLVAYYSRLFMLKNPQFKGFFRTRSVKGGEQGIAA